MITSMQNILLWPILDVEIRNYSSCFKYKLLIESVSVPKFTHLLLKEASVPEFQLLSYSFTIKI